MRVSAATLLLGALLLARCGSSTPTTPLQPLAPRSTTTATHAKQGAAAVLESPGAVRAFARYVVCMHAHGVRHVPTRTSPVRLVNALYAHSVTYRAANLACYRSWRPTRPSPIGWPPGAPGKSEPHARLREH